MVGHRQMLDQNKLKEHAKSQGLDFSNLFFKPTPWPEDTIYRSVAQDHGLENALLRLAPDRSREDLLLRFESLGDGTEFGVVQWYFGANPLGLLRFTHTPPGLLCAALRAKFQGVGEPENTVLFANRGEWISQDTRYLLAMHTHLREKRQRPRPYIRVGLPPLAISARQAAH